MMVSEEIRSGFYVAGGTLPRDAASYVPRQADRQLVESLRTGRFSYVLTSRQMGKSSLMVRTASALRQEGIACVVIDLTAVGQNVTEEQWYDGLVNTVGAQLDLEEELDAFWLAHARQSPLRRWALSLEKVILERVPGRIVFFVDEIDAVRSLPFSADEFFAAIRELYNRRAEDPKFERISFCLLGVATPSHLIRDTRTTPFNIGDRIDLSDFTPEEAAPLSQGLCRVGIRESRVESAERSTTRLLNRILHWTGGHPYLTQRLCQAVQEEIDNCQLSIVNGQLVDRLCESLFLSSSARERDDNLLFVRDQMLRLDEDVAAVLELYASVLAGRRVLDDETNPRIGALKLSGTVKVAGGRLLPRNRIYEHVFDRSWIRNNMPDAEVQRQRAAYRRGLIRAATFSAAVLGVIGMLAGVALQSAANARRSAADARAKQRIAQDKERETRQNLYDSDMLLAQRAADEDDLGRARDLLNAHRPRPGAEELRGFEWRYLWRLCQSADIRTFRGHTGLVSGVAFSPDGKLLASASHDGTLRLWNPATAQTLRVLTGHKDGVVGVSFSRDGRLLASASDDRTVRFWSTRSGREARRLITYREPPYQAVFSPDGRFLASVAEFGVVQLWDVATGNELARLDDRDARLGKPAFSPDGRLLACGFRNSRRIGTILWDMTRTARGLEEVAFLPERKSVQSCAFSPDGRLIAAGTDEGINLWDLPTRGKVAWLMGHRGNIMSVAFSPDGRFLASGGWDCTVRLWRVVVKREAAMPLRRRDGVTKVEVVALRGEDEVLRGHLDRLAKVEFAPDGKTIASASADGTVKLWSVTPRREPPTSLGEFKDAYRMAFSPNGNQLVAAGEVDGGNHSLKMWNLQTGGVLPVPDLHFGSESVEFVGFLAKGRTLITVGDYGRIELTDIASRRRTDVFDMKFDAKREGICETALSVDGRTLVVQSNLGLIRVWDLVARKLVHVLMVPLEGRAGAVALSPDARIMAVGTGSMVSLWDIATLRGISSVMYAAYGHIASLAFSPDGKKLAVGGLSKDVRLWDIQDPFRPTEMTPPLVGHRHNIEVLRFSPDGTRLASGSTDGTARLWDLRTHREIATFRGFAGKDHHIAFSPDGNILAIEGSDGNVRLLRAATIEEIGN